MNAAQLAVSAELAHELARSEGVAIDVSAHTTPRDLLRAIAAHCAAGGTLNATSPLLAFTEAQLSDRRPLPPPAPIVGSGLSEEDKRRRVLTLGSSEIAAVCGVNPYATIHDVWSHKCLGIETEETEAMRLGNLLEPTIFAIYADRYGIALTKGKYTVGPEPWISATPDAHRQGGGLVEAKLVGLRTIWQWGPGNTDDHESDEVPLHYLCQAQWQLLVTGEPFCDVAALLGTEFRTYRIRSNPDVQRKLMDRGRAFWSRHVLTREPPPADGSESARAMLRALYPRGGAEAVRADDELEALAARLRDAREAFGKAEAEKRLRENQIKERLKDARGAFGDGWRIRYAETTAKTRPFVFEERPETA